MCSGRGSVFIVVCTIPGYVVSNEYSQVTVCNYMIHDVLLLGVNSGALLGALLHVYRVVTILALLMVSVVAVCAVFDSFHLLFCDCKNGET